MKNRVIVMPYVSIGAQCADMFTKPLCKIRLDLLYGQRGLYDMYVSV